MVGWRVQLVLPGVRISQPNNDGICGGEGGWRVQLAAVGRCRVWLARYGGICGMPGSVGEQRGPAGRQATSGHLPGCQRMAVHCRSQRAPCTPWPCHPVIRPRELCSKSVTWEAAVQLEEAQPLHLRRRRTSQRSEHGLGAALAHSYDVCDPSSTAARHANKSSHLGW